MNTAMKGASVTLATVAMLACGSSGDTTQGASDAAPSDGAMTLPDAGADTGAACSPPLTSCSGACVDLQTSHDHCGACTTVCSAQQSCASGQCAGITYNDVTKASNWQSFDLFGVVPKLGRFSGGAFDGKYVYYAPFSSHGGIENVRLVRYDTSAPFASAGSWAAFDPTTLSPKADTFGGAVFDGQYVYFVPFGGPLVRYDTKASFSSPTAFVSVDPSKVLASGQYGFQGGTFDGRYLYLVPYFDTSVNYYASVAARYDTTADITKPSSWQSFDISQAHVDAEGYAGAVFDGRYVTFVPRSHLAQNAANPLVARFDTQGSFTDKTKWSVFDASTVDPKAAGFAGGAFDGQYVYLVPNRNSAARYDTKQLFSSNAAWSTFPQTSVDAALSIMELGGFDGRYVFYSSPLSPKVARYDTAAPFAMGGSWAVFDTGALSPAVGALSGAVYDGRYMYFPPRQQSNQGLVTARFDTKTAPSMPALPQFHGSFY